jgi:putative aminopeptidase FrvX
VRIGDAVVWYPRVLALHGSRLAGTTVDDRAGCAVLLDLATRRGDWPTVHLVFSVQEEFNLRGVLPAVRALQPDIALQIDLVLCADTPDMAGRGEVRLGGGPAISLYSFHGRGTLNGLIPHPALVALAEHAAEGEGLPLQRSAHTGALTETSYVQLESVDGIACLDMGFPCRHTHSALVVVDVDDLSALVTLLAGMLARVTPDLPLTRMPQCT